MVQCNAATGVEVEIARNSMVLHLQVYRYIYPVLFCLSCFCWVSLSGVPSFSERPSNPMQCEYVEYSPPFVLLQQYAVLTTLWPIKCHQETETNKSKCQLLLEVTIRSVSI
jgi:hypothetical protein